LARLASANAGAAKLRSTPAVRVAARLPAVSDALRFMLQGLQAGKAVFVEKPLKLWRQDKGQKACAAAFVQALREGGPAPIPLAEILEVSRVTIAVATSAARQDGHDTDLP